MRDFRNNASLEMPVILDNRFSDLDQLSADTKAWDLKFQLMQKGGFTGQMRQTATPDLLLTHARFSAKLHQAGSTPPGFQTFALPCDGCRGFWWLGHDIDSRCVLRFGSDSELDAVSNQDFSVYTLSVRHELIETLSEALGVSCPGSDRGVTRVRPRQMQDMLAFARTAVFEPLSLLRNKAAYQLVQRLLTYCANGEHLPRPDPSRRDRAIKHVIAFLDEHGNLQPDLSDLCKVAHVSERTLQYAFQERYGVSPSKFVRCWQLNAARRLIRSSARDNKAVAALAAECGFFDPSVFAKHYRLLHGELPSATLTKAKR